MLLYYRSKIRRMNNKNGIGFCGVLAIVFITLKLLKIINWSWLWVLSPIWIPTIIAIIIFIFVSWLLQ